MNKKIIIVILFFLVISAGIVFWFFSGEEQGALGRGLVILLPEPDKEVSLPLKITGYVNGEGWIGFEGQVGTVKLISQNGDQLASAVLTATTDWMNPLISFEASLEPQLIELGPAVLVFNNENPSGLEENSRESRLPVDISSFQGETLTIKVYFGKTSADSDCNVVSPAERTIPKVEAIARASMEQLLSGLTESEKAQGFFSSINQGVILQGLTIENKTARADFNEQLEYQIGGSCRVAAIRAQIAETLKQFPTVEDVIISINGRTEDILQP